VARVPILAALPAFALGVIWRWLHVYQAHDPRGTVYSDMAVYISIARRIANESYRLTPLDVTHPPGASWMFSQFFQSDPSFFTLMLFQVVVASLIPLGVGLLAWVAFDQKSAAWAIAVSSGYFYYVEYAGFFLSEIYMMLLNPLIMALYLLAVRAKKPTSRVTLAVVAGALFFIAIAFKTVSVPALLGFCGVHWLFTRGESIRVKTLVIAIMCLMTVPGLYLTSQRCTQASRGDFCLTSNKGPSDFLLGHYGRIQSIKWTDSQFGSPGAQQHSYEHVPQVWFSITDGEQNTETAWEWIWAHPGEAIVLSVQHVFDLLSPNAPWPTIWTGEWIVAQTHSYLFGLLLIYPACLLLFDIARAGGPWAMFRSVEFAIMSVLFGVMLSVAIATGETRYRLPYDCVFIVLGVEFYRRMLARHAWRFRKRPLRNLPPAPA